jgi:hypothetical protein
MAQQLPSSSLSRALHVTLAPPLRLLPSACAPVTAPAAEELDARCSIAAGISAGAPRRGKPCRCLEAAGRPDWAAARLRSCALRRAGVQLKTRAKGGIYGTP